MGAFTDLGLSSIILQAIEERGYKEPTPIQALAIPHVLMGRDVLGCAQTGTGKTAGFCLPMLEILSNGRAKARMPRSLILEPTRELAAQVEENFIIYGKYTGMTTALLTGGQGMDEQIKKLERGVDVLIATPGRMLDLFDRGKVLLQDLKIFVIDEADRMLDMGFIPDIEKIAGLLPKLRQTLFFSATMPPEIKKLADRFLMNPKEVSVSPPATTAATVEQAIVRVNAVKKREILRALLRGNDFKSAFIFCNRKRDVAQLNESLSRHGFSVAALHGDMVQTQRNEALDKFKKGEVAVLVCSDVAARGLDVKGADVVFNFDVPFNADDYVHRIGRTGRAGKEGKAFTFVTPDEALLLQNIVTLIKREIPEIHLDGFAVENPEINAANAPAHEPRQIHARREGNERRGSAAGSRRSSPSYASGGKTRFQKDKLRPQHMVEQKKEQPARSERGREARLDQEPMAHNGVVGFGDDLPAFLMRKRERNEVPAEKTVI